MRVHWLSERKSMLNMSNFKCVSSKNMYQTSKVELKSFSKFMGRKDIPTFFAWQSRYPIPPLVINDAMNLNFWGSRLFWLPGSYCPPGVITLNTLAGHWDWAFQFEIHGFKMVDIQIVRNGSKWLFGFEDLSM